VSVIALVRATFADRAEAERIAKAVVEARLAACANLGAVESIYTWEGAIESGSEVAGIFKTRATLAQFLAARIAALHSYDLPAVTWWTVHAEERLAAWVEAATDD